MIAIFDTSSWYNLVKYYLPLDKKGELKYVIKINYEAGEIRLIDKVFRECRWTQQGFILDGLEFLQEKSNHIKTDDILPNKQFFGYVDHQFCDKDIIKEKNHSEAEVEVLKKNYLEGADCKLMLYAQTLLAEKAFIVTEESRQGNDGKVHKKIPINCDLLGIDCITLPNFLNKYFDFGIKKNSDDHGDWINF